MKVEEWDEKIQPQELLKKVWVNIYGGSKHFFKIMNKSFSFGLEKLWLGYYNNVNLTKKSKQTNSLNIIRY
jgi:hypothetical protein